MPAIDCNTFHASYKPGDTVRIDDEISGFVTKVSFTVGRGTPLYSVEWFHNGQLQQGEFFPEQLKD